MENIKLISELEKVIKRLIDKKDDLELLVALENETGYGVDELCVLIDDTVAGDNKIDDTVFNTLRKYDIYNSTMAEAEIYELDKLINSWKFIENKIKAA